MRLLLFVLVAFGSATAEAAAPSPGCGRAEAPPPAAFHVAGSPREAIVVLPASYRPGRPYPLVLAFHGRTNSNEQARGYFGLEDAALPAIHVYPAGLRDASGRFTWSDPGDPPEGLRDFALFDTIVAGLAARYCVDLDSVFVAGHSLGASFANSLACARGGQVRAVGSVAGGIDGGSCTGRAAALLLHNPADRAVPVVEGQRAREMLLGDPAGPVRAVPRQVGRFACEAAPKPSGPVIWCPYRDSRSRSGRHYPHTWPSGAGTAIRQFFAELAG